MYRREYIKKIRKGVFGFKINWYWGLFGINK